jgi:hypothetical protein
MGIISDFKKKIALIPTFGVLTNGGNSALGNPFPTYYYGSGDLFFVCFSVFQIGLLKKVFTCCPVVISRCCYHSREFRSRKNVFFNTLRLSCN